MFDHLSNPSVSLAVMIKRYTRITASRRKVSQPLCMFVCTLIQVIFFRAEQLV